QLQWRLVAEHRDHRAERDDRERQEGRHSGQDRRQEVHRFVSENRDDFLFEGQLHAVRERLQRAPRTGPVRADPVLHAADDLAFEYDREQRHHHEEHEDANDLDQDDPERGTAEPRYVGSHCAPPWDIATAPAGRIVTGSLATAPRLDRTAQPRALVGNHTTSSGRSAISAGTVTPPRSLETVSNCPSVTPARAAVVADSSARAGFAVPARFSSPSDIRPASSSSCQVARTVPFGA